MSTPKKPPVKPEEESKAGDSTLDKLEEAMGSQEPETEEPIEDPVEAKVEEAPVVAIPAGHILLSSDQFQELIGVIVANKPNQGVAESTIPEGERFFARTNDQRFAQYPQMSDSQAKEGRTEEFRYQRVEKLPAAWEDELGSRASLMLSLGWEIYGHSSMFFYCRKPLEEWKKEDAALQAKAQKQKRVVPDGAEEGVSVDERSFEEISIKDLFESLSDSDKTKFVSDPKTAAQMIGRAASSS